MSEAQQIVNAILEDENEKWDNVHKSMRELYGTHMLAHKKYRELARSVEYHRALARLGLEQKDVAHVVTAGQIGAIDNYKNTRPDKKCMRTYCELSYKSQPMDQDTCSACGEPLMALQVPYSRSDLQKMSGHYVGVDLKDGRRVWFDEPLSPTPWLNWAKEDAKPKTPVPPASEEQERLGKWW